MAMEDYRINKENGLEFGLYSLGDHMPNALTGKRVSAKERIDQIVAEAKLAEEAGLDFFSVGESHQKYFVGQAHAVILGAVAQATEKIKIGSSATIVSTSDPVRIYENFATLDLLSNGRAEIIGGRASRLGLFDLLGYNVNDYEELFEEKFNQESIYPFYKERFKKQFPYLSLSNIVEIAGFLIIYGYIFYGISQKIIPLSSFVMYVTMMTNFLSSLQEFGVEIFNVRNSMIYVKTYFKFIDRYHKPQDGKDIKTWNTIRFENVSYQYPESCQYAIKDLSLEIHNGEKISIVGENGSGKTTFIKLLLRLLPVTSGNIYIDNISIYDMSFEDYIKRFSATFQDYKLLAFTIAENLSMANAYEDEQLKQVLEAFHLDFLKTQLSKDYSKRFHDDGIILSGGEEQRLAIARSLLKDSDILILDEPTASLDAYTEKQLYGLVREITQDKTLILITHRLINSTLTDRILMFQDGRIVEDGSQHDLLLKNGKYKNLYDKQILFQ